MVKKEFVFILLMAFCLSFRTPALAQSKGLELKRNVARVLFSTLGGAILGLSTLSFYGEPQEHTANITTGALLGLIAGGGYVTYTSLQKQQSMADPYAFAMPQVELEKGRLVVARAPLLLQIETNF